MTGRPVSSDDRGDEQHRGAFRSAEHRDPGGEQGRRRLRHVPEQHGVGEESELVEVDRGPLPAGEHEVAVQLRGGHHPPHEVVFHGRRSRGHRADSIRAWVVATAAWTAGTEPSGGRRSSPSLPKPRTASPRRCLPCRCRGSGSAASSATRPSRSTSAGSASRTRSVSPRASTRRAGTSTHSGGWDSASWWVGPSRGRRGTGTPSPGSSVRRGARAIVNSMGLPNPGAEAAAANLARARRTAPRFASVADEELREAMETVELLAPHVDGFELNASSPNAPWRHDPAHMGTLLAAFGRSTDLPVLLKLPPFRTDEDRATVLDLARTAVDAGAQGLVCSNTLAVEEPRLATGRGGLSGGPLTELTPRIVADVAAATGAPGPDRCLRRHLHGRRRPPLPRGRGHRRPALHGADLSGPGDRGRPHPRPPRRRLRPAETTGQASPLHPRAFAVKIAGFATLRGREGEAASGGSCPHGGGPSRGDERSRRRRARRRRQALRRRGRRGRGQPGHPAGGVLLVARAIGVREDDLPPDDRGLRAAHVRSDPARRPRRAPISHPSSAT